MNNQIQILEENELDYVAGGPLPLVVVAAAHIAGRAAVAAATSTTGKAVFAGAAAIAGAAAAGVFGKDD